MPLKAIYTPTSQRLVSLWDQEEIVQLRMTARKAGTLHPFICPLCEQFMKFTGQYHRGDGYEVAAHFAHLVDCTSNYRYHKESPEHIQAKAHIVAEVPRRFPEVQEAECEVEYRIPEINRVADVAFLYPDGDITIHEAQLSPITIDELMERTNDYRAIGARVVWHLGPKNYKHSQWCKEELGVYSLLSISLLQIQDNDDRMAA